MPSRLSAFTSVFTAFTLILIQCVTQSSCQSYRRNGEPININWVFSLPWDVSNTLRAPLGGPLSLLLCGGLSIIMFFSLAVSPIYYLLGTPPRNQYHWHDAIIDRLTLTNRESRSRDSTEFNSTLEAEHYPDFVNSLFWLIGEEDRECQKLMVCHSHGWFNFLPDKYFQLYGLFSRRMVSIPEDFQEAIQSGLEAQSSCMPKYQNCPHGLFDIAKKTAALNMPKDLSFLFRTVKRVILWLSDYE